MDYMGKKIWQEDPSAADDYRQRYVDGIAAYIRMMNKACKKERRSFMPPHELVKNPEFYRQKYKEMLGLDQFEQPASKPVEMTYVAVMSCAGFIG